MIDVSFTPKRKTKWPEIAVAGTMVIMALSVLFLVLQWGNQLLMQGLFFVCCVVAIYLMTRYMMRTFTYRIRGEDPVFEVVSTTGRRRTTLCRLSIRQMFALRLYAKEDDAKKGTQHYSYCTLTNPPVSYLLFFKEEGRTVTIRVEIEGEFLHLMKEAVDANLKRLEEEAQDE